MKSIITSVCYPAWKWTTDPSHRFLCGSYASGLATELSVKRRNLIESEWYQQGYGKRYKLASDVNTKSEFANDKTGHMNSAGILGSITGKGADTLLIDDAHDPKGAVSKADRNSVVENFDQAWTSRLNDKKNGTIIVIMQRLHPEDLTGHLLAKDMGYEHLCLPSIAEKYERHVFPVSGKIIERQVGDILHPERDGQAELDQARRDLGSFGFAGQHQQQPVTLGGNIIKGSNFKLYKLAPKMLYRKIFVDTAQKTAERNDYSVLECWGLAAEGGIYLLDMIRGKWEAPLLQSMTQAFWNKHKAEPDTFKMGMLREMVVEDKSSGTGLIQTLKITRQIPIVALQRAKDKLTRVMDFLPYHESGQVFLPEEAPFTSDFMSECEAFTADDTHAFDDQIDPMLDAAVDMLDIQNPMRQWEKLATG